MGGELTDIHMNADITPISITSSIKNTLVRDSLGFWTIYK